ncbi:MULTISPECIES: hypothetical protein [Streptomyces]|uniref:hypothetical protein n=1 Tax=Streptomyces TaxID=1883 RepID=UPI0016707300|nr:MULTISPECIES: hypothetical protein [Streptomyces]UFR00096.1 hypothetical protein KBP30_02360 [Streptomyces sp. Go40/10]GGS93573.1 hypothetical protein GCM10010206_65370 [Streptomyces cinerochromogenes]
MSALIFGIIASAAAVFSILFSAWQIRQLTRQTVITNGIAAASAIYNSVERLHNVGTLIFQHPQLNKYFFNDAPVPGPGDEKEQVLTLAHMFADALDYGLMIKSLAPGTSEYDCWDHYVAGMFASSPALRQVVLDHPSWWPTLAPHLPEPSPPAGVPQI